MPRRGGYAFIFFVTIILVCSDRDGISAHSHAGTWYFPVQPNKSWQEFRSVDEAWENYSSRIRKMLAALNLDRPDLQKVKSSLKQRDTTAALNELLNYFRIDSKDHWLLKNSSADPETHTQKEADDLLNHTVTFNGVTAKVPRAETGGWDWKFAGPNGDQEFGYSLNGHQYLATLLAAWKETGDDLYVKTFDAIIRDWIIHNPVPAKGDTIYNVLKGLVNKLDYRDIGEVRWRTLEAGNRLGVSWPYAFLSFQQSDAFTPAARILMLTGFVEHAEYLREYHKQGHNWTTMEMNGLALTGLTFPEFKNAEEWIDYAFGVMKKEIYRQVYPDGVQTEVSTKTQWVALRRFESVADYFLKSGREIPDEYIQRIEEMYNYLAYAMRPDGHQPLNNDSDREDLRPRVLAAAKKFNRQDWEWIATNGEKGTRPEGLPSTVFPWAGIHVMRNGWDRQSHWTFFDTGPFGTGHQHADMLHLSISAYGRDLLVDGGRYTHEDYFSFDPRIWRGYFRSSFSHNVILVDGGGQKAGPLTSKSPLQEGTDFQTTAEYDYARGTFANGYEGVEGQVEHTRAVLYVKDKMWVVVDHIDADQPRTLQALWHYSPESLVNIEKGTTVSTNPGAGNLRIIPVGMKITKTDIVKGKTEPVIQGWYSKEYGKKEASPTAIYALSAEGPATTFAWVLLPAFGRVPEARVKLVDEEENGLRLRISVAGDQPIEVFVPVANGSPELH